MKLRIEDVFTIAGRGTVVTGIVLEGSIHTGDQVEILTSSGERLSTVVRGIEMSKKVSERASAGDNVGLLLRGITRAQVERGDVVLS